MVKKAQKSQSNGYNLIAKVSPKGAISIYGMGRFPVTLYADQLEAILDKAEALRAFIEENRGELKEKPEAGSRIEGGTHL